MDLETSTNTISGKIESIIREAHEELYIVSPYFQLDNWNNIKNSLNFALKNDAKIKLFARNQKKEKIEKLLEQISEFRGPNFKIYLVENLHAKVYYNENEALITSMNLYLHSAENNYELGVILRKKDEDKRKKLYDYIQYLMEYGEEYLSEEEIEKKKEKFEIISNENLQEIQFQVISKGYKWFKVETPEGYENKIEIEEAPHLELRQNYKAKAKIIWKKTPYGFNVIYRNIQDLLKI